MTPIASTKIKFCGFTREADIDAALELQVDFIGLIFSARSPRRLTPERGAQLRRRVPAGTKTVALVMDAPCEDVRAVVDTVEPDLIQFHGAEPDGFCAGFGLPFWKAIAMGGAAQTDSSQALLARCAAWPSAQALLFDGHAAGEQGGSGRRFDWSRLSGGVGKPFLLAGGLNADNVAQAIAIARPWGVDIASGIEAAPGVKDAAKMRTFAAAVRTSDRV